LCFGGNYVFNKKATDSNSAFCEKELREELENSKRELKTMRIEMAQLKGI
jgi:hypothetical protein